MVFSVILGKRRVHASPRYASRRGCSAALDCPRKTAARKLYDISGSVIDEDTDFGFASQTTVLAELERAFGNEIRVEFGR